MNKTKIKIDDVARIAEVSVSTVSRALNNRPDVAEKTRQRILRVIEELGYQPNTQAQSLAAGQARTVSLLFPMPHMQTTQLELDFFVSAAHTASAHGYTFNLMVNEITENSLLNLYRSGDVAGVILMQIHLDDWRVNLLQSQQLPFVMIGRCSDNTGLNYVDYDFETGIQIAFEYLLEHGHRDIAFIARPEDTTERGLGSAVRLLHGYDSVCRAQSIRRIYQPTQPSLAHVYDATLHILTQYPKTSAIVTVNGNTAPAIIRAARALRKKVPEDLSIVAIATSSIAELVEPTLTTVDFPSAQMGVHAAEMLIQQINTVSSDVEQILIPAHIIERGSTRQYDKDDR